jgi:hypothetical protein
MNHENHESLFSGNQKYFLGIINCINYRKRVSFYKTQKQWTSLFQRQNLTELTVIFVIAGEWGKLTGHLAPAMRSHSA